MAQFERLGIVAGSGDLPLRIARRARDEGAHVSILAIEGQADPDIFDDFPTAVIRLGAAGTAMAWARSDDLVDLVFAGAVRRPSLRELRPDATATKILGRNLLSFGDDGLLRRIIQHLEEKEGFRIHPVSAVLEDVTVPPGPLTRIGIPEDRAEDVQRGISILRALDVHDVGQGVCVQDGIVLGIEGAEGTDSLISRCGELKKEGSGPILVKLSKRDQTEQADLPTVGVGTIRSAARAGFSGIVIEAKRCLVLERDECVSLAEENGLFLEAVADIER